jgi:hypothetical protein
MRQYPAHGYFRDRLQTLYDGSIDAQMATSIDIMEGDIHDVMAAGDTSFFFKKL